MKHGNRTGLKPTTPVAVAGALLVTLTLLGAAAAYAPSNTLAQSRPAGTMPSGPSAALLAPFGSLERVALIQQAADEASAARNPDRSDEPSAPVGPLRATAPVPPEPAATSAEPQKTSPRPAASPSPADASPELAPEPGTNLLEAARRWGEELSASIDRISLPQTSELPPEVNDVLGQVSAVTRELLTPEQIEALSRGDWNAVATGLQAELYARLVEMGASPWEAEAILQKDWAALGVMAQDRLVQTLSDRYNLAPELIQSILARDWQSARAYAQQQAIQHLLAQLLL